jgi:hypothetical protein
MFPEGKVKWGKGRREPPFIPTGGLSPTDLGEDMPGYTGMKRPFNDDLVVVPDGVGVRLSPFGREEMLVRGESTGKISQLSPRIAKPGLKRQKTGEGCCGRDRIDFSDYERHMREIGKDTVYM